MYHIRFSVHYLTHRAARKTINWREVVHAVPVVVLYLGLQLLILIIIGTCL